MDTERESNCLGTLLDLICYEIDGRRLSFEMEGLLQDHLRECSSCRKKVADYRQVAASREPAYPR